MSDIQDVLRYQASSAGDTRMGVLQPATGFTPSGNISLRGFPINSRLRNGLLRYTAYNLDNVERVEVVKGPAAVLYGSSQPGGFVNTISKRPLRDARASVRATVGSYSKRRAEIDVNRPIVGDKLLFRFLAAYDHFDTHRDFENTETSGSIPSSPGSLSRRST